MHSDWISSICIKSTPKRNRPAVGWHHFYHLSSKYFTIHSWKIMSCDVTFRLKFYFYSSLLPPKFLISFSFGAGGLGVEALFYDHSIFISFILFLIVAYTTIGSGDWPNPSFCFWWWEEENHLPWRWKGWLLPNFEAWGKWFCDAKEELSSVEAHSWQPKANQGKSPWMEHWRGAGENPTTLYRYSSHSR